MFRSVRGPRFLGVAMRPASSWECRSVLRLCRKLPALSLRTRRSSTARLYRDAPLSPWGSGSLGAGSSRYRDSSNSAVAATGADTPPCTQEQSCAGDRRYLALCRESPDAAHFPVSTRPAARVNPGCPPVDALSGLPEKGPGPCSRATCMPTLHQQCGQPDGAASRRSSCRRMGAMLVPSPRLRRTPALRRCLPS